MVGIGFISALLDKPTYAPFRGSCLRGQDAISNLANTTPELFQYLQLQHKHFYYRLPPSCL